MARTVSESFKLLYLDQEEPGRPLFSTPVRTASPNSISTLKKPRVTPRARHGPPPVNRNPSIKSSNSSTTSNRDNKSVFSRKDSTSTQASSSSIPPWRAPPTFVQQLMAAPTYDYGYDLPCEFFFLGCGIRFNPAHLEQWISHSESHFVNKPLPPTAICTFCDEETFQSHGDAALNWRNRMLHIHEHLSAFTPSEHMRPDFWVIEHMQEYGLISPEDHAHAQQGTERPYCENLYPLDYETPDMVNENERASHESHNIGKEDRQRRKEGKKDKSTHKPSYSHRPRKSHVKVTVTVEGS